MDFTPIQNRFRPLIKPEGESQQPKALSPIKSFGKYLENSIGEVNKLKKAADVAVNKLTTGEDMDIHSTMIKMQKASISFEMLMQVRNKVISAYDEIKRMQL